MCIDITDSKTEKPARPNKLQYLFFACDQRFRKLSQCFHNKIATFQIAHSELADDKGV